MDHYDSIEALFEDPTVAMWEQEMLLDESEQMREDLGLYTELGYFPSDFGSQIQSGIDGFGCCGADFGSSVGPQNLSAPTDRFVCRNKLATMVRYYGAIAKNEAQERFPYDRKKREAYEYARNLGILAWYNQQLALCG